MKNIRVLVIGGAALFIVAVVAFILTSGRDQNLEMTTSPNPEQEQILSIPRVAAARNAVSVNKDPSKQPTNEKTDTVAKEVNPGIETAVLSEQAFTIPSDVSQPVNEKTVTSPQKKTRASERELQDPMAREILKLVGSDSDAEAYWIRAIFDKSLSDKERDDLIEDLNEEGLSDPKNPGPQDRRLIETRLLIIEEIYPYADSVMVPHLQEAYKDLQNLLEITEGGGKPVK